MQAIFFVMTSKAPYGLWWMAAQTFIRWGRHGTWERLRFSMAFLDGSNIRAHQKATGGGQKGDPESPA